MKFTKPNLVMEIVEGIDKGDENRRHNRARINRLFNGDSPYTAKEEEEAGIYTNVNFLEGTKLIHDARSQFASAFLKPERMVTVRFPDAPADIALQMQEVVSREVSKEMKRSLRYVNTQESKFASVVLHGVGAVLWDKDDDWCPTAVALEDIGVPSSTLVSMENLTHFFVRRKMTVGELAERTVTAEEVRSGWNMRLVKKLLTEGNEEPTQGPGDESDHDFPEKVVEDWKENSGYYHSDKAATCKLIYFYHRDDEGRWFRKIVVESSFKGSNSMNDDFLFNDDEPYRESLSELAHWQFANGANVAPFRYHSVRSLGYLLYQIFHLSNRLRCRIIDTTFREMLMLFRQEGGEGEMRQLIDLYDMGTVPNGLSFIPAAERHQVNTALTGASISMLRQHMADQSTAFTQSIDNGSNRQMTATEALQLAASANALTGSMLGKAYTLEEFCDAEIVRRMFGDEKIRARLIKMGIPEEFLERDQWEVHRNRTVGNGHKQMELLMAENLRQYRPMLTPRGQRLVDRIFVLANTDDPKLADELAPLDDDEVTSSQERASLAWGVLIDGKQPMIRDNINAVEYVEVLIGMLDQELQQAGDMVDMRRLMGIQNVIQHISMMVDQIAGDQSQAWRVKIYQDQLGNAANVVKAMAQRLQEQMEAQGGSGNPKLDAELQAMVVKAEAQAEIKKADAAQKRQHKDDAFYAEMERRGSRVRADLAEKDVRTASDIASQQRVSRAKAEGAQKVRAGEISRKS
jgi:hypothetical protein